MIKVKMILGDGTEWIKECETHEEAERIIQEMKEVTEKVMGDKLKRFTVLKDVSRDE